MLIRVFHVLCHPSWSEFSGIFSSMPAWFHLLTSEFSRYCISHHDHRFPSWIVSSVSTNFEILRHATSSVLTVFMSSITKQGIQAWRHPKYTVREFRILRHPSWSGFPVFCVICHDQSFQVFQVLCHPLHTEFFSCFVRYLNGFIYVFYSLKIRVFRVFGHPPPSESFQILPYPSYIQSLSHKASPRPITFWDLILKLLWSPGNRFQGIDSASLVGRYDNPIPTRFL